MNAIEIQNISKSYNQSSAIKDISFNVGNSELFGLIGPDGAGKTTLFRLLTSLLIPDEGKAIVEGYDTVKDFKKLRKIIGYMPGKFSLYQDLTVEENLNFFATIFQTTIKENYHLIKDIYIQLEPFKRRRAGNLSGGMKQKLALCCALIHEPKVLFLDEPTTGVDAVSRAEFWEMLNRLRARGISILVSTPYMDEATQCERIALIQEGSILGIDTPENIKRYYKDNLFALSSKNLFKLLKTIREAPFSKRAELFGEQIHVSGDNGLQIEEIKKYVNNFSFEDFEIKRIEPSIEDIFLQLMK